MEFQRQRPHAEKHVIIDFSGSVARSARDLKISERGAAWFAHYTGGVGVGGSNPLAPTIFQYLTGGVLLSRWDSGGRSSSDGGLNTGEALLHLLFKIQRLADLIQVRR